MPANKRPVLGCDIDGVVCEFFTAFDQWVEQMYGLPAETCDRYDWFLKYPHGGKLWSAAHAEGIAEKLYSTALPTPGAVPALHELVHRGWDIHFATYRPRLLADTTRQWLDTYNMPWPVSFPEYKGDLKCDLYLDDYPRIVTALRDGGHAAYLFDREWNRDVTLPRVHGWEHMLDLTENWIAA